MALACQMNSYLKTLSTSVKACSPKELSLSVNGKKEKLSGYEVLLEDTILFPEGGGQPDDRGTINGIPVVNVCRRGAEAVHFVEKPIEVGSPVELELDWTRRWDHMQQHSGQHLITAIAISEFGFQTTSWNLGEKISSIELDTPEMTPEQMSKLEMIVNEKIRQAILMYPTLYSGVDDPEIKSVRTRGLPEDHEGPVRVVTIDGIETNMCCGTHVAKLSDLQAIKLLGVEKGKKGRINLLFLAGDRILKYLASCFEREKAFTAMLKGPPDDHIDLMQKIQNSLKIAQKNSLTLLREVAKYEADRFKSNENRPPLFVLHKKEGDNEFMNIIANEIADENVLLFLTTGEEKGPGLFMLVGKPEDVSVLGPKVAELLDGKGAGKPGRFQGKANRLQKRSEVENILKDYIKEKQSVAH